MKPLCIVPVYNEADILPWTLRHIVEQGCEPFVLDNMSTDNPASVMTPGNPVYGWDSDFEQIFTGGKYDWTAILKRIEEIALDRGKGRWCMLYDADEIRRAVGPFHGATLAEACARVEAEGYNAIDHYVRCFAPIDNGYQGDPEAYFRHYLPEHVDQRMPHIKCWLQGDERVDLHTHGGHQVMFHGRRVYPVPFLLKHYPIRSQQHGERKVFQERLPRYLESEREKKWHVQYDGYKADKVLYAASNLIPVRRDVTIVTLTGFKDIFDSMIAPSVERYEPIRRRIVVTSRGVKIDRPGWDVIEGPEPFAFARNLNLGIRAAGSDDVLAVNDDVAFNGPIIEQLQRIENIPPCGLTTPQVDGGINNSQCRIAQKLTHWTQTSKVVPFVCVLLRRECLKDIGLLDERFDGYGGDDEEWCLRAMARGWSLAVTPHAVVKHGYDPKTPYSSSFYRVMSREERDESMARMRAIVREVAK